MQSLPHCFSVYPFTSFSYRSVPTRLIACSSRFLGSPTIPALCLAIISLASSGVEIPHIFEKVFILKGILYIWPL